MPLFHPSSGETLKNTFKRDIQSQLLQKILLQDLRQSKWLFFAINPKLLIGKFNLHRTWFLKTLYKLYNKYVVHKYTTLLRN